MQLDRNTSPAGGWDFYQPETDWSLPSPINHSFNTAAAAIAAHRRANPALADRASVAACEADLEAYTKQRLGLNTGPYTIPVNAPATTRTCRTCG